MGMQSETAGLEQTQTRPAWTPLSSVLSRWNGTYTAYHTPTVAPAPVGPFRILFKALALDVVLPNYDFGPCPLFLFPPCLTSPGYVR